MLDDVISPFDVAEIDVRTFVIKLVNRLLFVKFLEDRGVLPDKFLIERINKYKNINNDDDSIGGTLYKSQLEPLFFYLFNTPVDSRLSKHRGRWFDNVPYLNGSLFEPENRDKEYDVDDRMLITVVEDLIEGHKLREKESDKGFDPSLLGNVFEMTINYLSQEINGQKKEGAYYTPNDVIRVIVSQTVLPKIYDVLVNVYSKKIMMGSTDINEETACNFIKAYQLDEILKKIEDNEGYFGDPSTIRLAYQKLGELKVIDAACGSGHFLTAILDEIHRVRLSLLRGLYSGKITNEDIYNSKKELVLNSIYGVDINPIAIEIAKLRVWLKMVEEGWEEKYGELPNININIVDGNSLIGLPAISGVQTMLEQWVVDLSKIQDVRKKYKNGELNRNELTKKIKILKPELTDVYINNLNHTFIDKIEHIEKFDDLVNSVSVLSSIVFNIKLTKKNNAEFSDEEVSELKQLGFKTYKKSARIVGKNINKIIIELKTLITDGYILELTRKPIANDVYDLDKLGELSYKPFHWMIEFPETANKHNEDSIKFDIVIGNPPYGDILKDVEKRFIKGYKTGHLNDIAAQFVERELQLLSDDGYFGNVITLRFVYERSASVVRQLIRKNIDDVKIACFATRPSKIFDSSEPRVAIITGKKKKANSKDSDLKTSIFIRFNENDRDNKLRDISYESTDGLFLGEKIGSGEDYSLPKIGNSTIKNILEKLKMKSDYVFRDVISRNEVDKYVVWRKRGPRYWINPFFENLYGHGNEPSDFDPIYFKNEILAKSAFLLMQSSLFYLCWMVYGDQRHLNWTFIEAFPFPAEEDLLPYEETIIKLTEKIWMGMKKRFNPTAGLTGEIQNMSELKSLIDEVDELFGPLFNLTDDEIQYIKKYDAEYGRSSRSK